MNLRDALRGPDANLDEQIESYATQRVPADKRWPRLAILLVLTGNITAMFWFLLGGQLGFLVGWPMVLVPIAYMVLGATVIGGLIMRIASKEGLSLPLLSRGLGFGVKGSAVASIVYGVNYVFYFIFEGSIVSHALSAWAGIPVDSFLATIVFAGISLAALYYSWRGMHSMNILQRFGLPIFLVLFVVGMVMLGNGYVLVGPGQWQATGGMGAAAMWQAMSMVNGQIVFQGLIATDYGRFVKKSVGYRGTSALMFIELAMCAVVVLFGTFIGFTMLKTFEGSPNPEVSATDPGLYFAVIMGFLGVVFAFVTQVRINVMNLYSGSLALSNAADALVTRKIGRQWWMVGLVVVGVLVYPLNVLQYTDKFLAVTGIMTNTWIFILLADYFICRKAFKLAPSTNIEYEESAVPSWNPAGITAMVAGIAVGAAGIFGAYPSYYASFIAMAIGPVVYVPMMVLTRGRFYSKARKQQLESDQKLPQTT
ncbi:purine-cytosine permease family protein [Pseudarthrobacter sp. YAF2]|uniref:purine-cytosine permease family protein n=1 Tax=Pseudarthrobacter sp. YAF2 TaxID=3233078 RepID=UPI003F9470CF